MILAQCELRCYPGHFEPAAAALSDKFVFVVCLLLGVEDHVGDIRPKQDFSPPELSMYAVMRRGRFKKCEEVLRILDKNDMTILTGHSFSKSK